MIPTLTICVPTIGRPGLKDTLASIARQMLIKGDRVLVVLDTHAEPPRPDVRELVASYGFELLEHDAGYHFMGNPQLNQAIARANTHFFIALGDDDVYVDGAFSRLRKRLEFGRVTLFQFYSPPFDGTYGPQRFVLWNDRHLREANISGCCIAAPVHKLVPVSDERRIEVDYDWICAIVKKTGQSPIWMRDCLVIARPDVRNGETVHRGVVQCRGCGVVAYLEDLDGYRLCAGCQPHVLREHLGASA